MQNYDIFLLRLKAVGKPMIVVLYHGAPLATPVFDTDVDVMLSAGYTGQGTMYMYICTKYRPPHLYMGLLLATVVTIHVPSYYIVYNLVTTLLQLMQLAILIIIMLVKGMDQQMYTMYTMH